MNNCIILGLCLYCLCQNSRSGNNGNDDWGCGGNGRNGRNGNGNWDGNGGSGRSGRGNDDDGCDCVEPRFEPRFDARPFGNNRETTSCEEKGEQDEKNF